MAVQSQLCCDVLGFQEEMVRTMGIVPSSLLHEEGWGSAQGNQPQYLHECRWELQAV
jgi:hypothetical protein